VILIYAFSNQWGTNISRRVLLELEKLLPKNIPINYQLIYFHPKSFFNKYIKNNDYDLIIGLGDFFGNISHIRLETTTHNVYGQNSIHPFSPINLEISLPLLDNLDTKIYTVSEHMGKYNCNWIAYFTELYIRQYSLRTKQLFLHLPKSQNATKLALQIKDLLIFNGHVQASESHPRLL
jgi:pyrrolidone-carboxylate peptidase